VLLKDRYRINISDPRLDLSVFVWDAKKKEILVSFSYPKLGVYEQQRAMDKCKKYVECLDYED